MNTNTAPETTLIRQLRVAIQRGDRIAAIRLAQRAWHAGDIRRTAVVAMHLTDREVPR